VRVTSLLLSLVFPLSLLLAASLSAPPAPPLCSYLANLCVRTHAGCSDCKVEAGEGDHSQYTHEHYLHDCQHVMLIICGPDDHTMTLCFAGRGDCKVIAEVTKSELEAEFREQVCVCVCVCVCV
jgi:hypothetical protein